VTAKREDQAEKAGEALRLRDYYRQLCWLPAELVPTHDGHVVILPVSTDVGGTGGACQTE
jgi:hypothetical protein